MCSVFFKQFIVHSPTLLCHLEQITTTKPHQKKSTQHPTNNYAQTPPQPKSDPFVFGLSKPFIAFFAI